MAVTAELLQPHNGADERLVREALKEAGEAEVRGETCATVRVVHRWSQTRAVRPAWQSQIVNACKDRSQAC